MNKATKRRKKVSVEPKVTFRQLRRENTIIETIQQNQVVADPTKLFKMIQENELREGYKARMDKKSLLRILSRLAARGLVKNILVRLEMKEMAKSLHFVCAPHIDENNSLIQSSIEQAKMKFNSYLFSPSPDPDLLNDADADTSRDLRDDTPLSLRSTSVSRGTTPEPLSSPVTRRDSQRKGFKV